MADWYLVEAGDYRGHHYITDEELLNELKATGHTLTKQEPVTVNSSDVVIWNMSREPNDMTYGSLQAKINAFEVVLKPKRIECDRWKEEYVKLSREQYVPLTDEEIQEGFLNNSEEYQGWVDGKEGGWRLCKRVKE